MRTQALALCMQTAACLAALPAAAQTQAPQPSGSEPTKPANEQVIVPEVARRNVKLPRYPSNDFEIGVFAGTYATENFGTSEVDGLRLGYHVTEDIFVLKQVALAGCGVAELPPIACRDELADGRLVHVLPQWRLPDLALHAVFPSRTGMPQAVRCFIDYLALQIDSALDDASTSTMRVSLVANEAPGQAMRME